MTKNMQTVGMSRTPRILSTATSVPDHRWSQQDIYELMARHFPRYRNGGIEKIFMNSEIDTRHLAFGQDDFDPTATADDLNAHFLKHALELGESAISRCLESAGLSAADVDYLVVATSTGYVCPGLSAHLVRSLNMRTETQRADLVGMGCAGALPALQRAHDYVKAYPDRRALLLTVEICSACWYVDDSLETVVGNAICADGAAAVLIGSDDHASGPRLEDFETLLEPALLESVGFQSRSGKLRIVLSKDVRKVAGGLVRRAVDNLLERNRVKFEEIDHWVVHSGGRKVLDNLDEAMGFNDGELEESRAVLREFGNMSSPTVLFVLDRVVRSRQPQAGALGVVVALGPGLVAETSLIRW